MKVGHMNWRSRIVKRGTILASQITPHPQNPRKHPETQRHAVAASFDELGQIAPIVININNGYLVDGEERSWLALDQAEDVEIEAVWVDLTEAEHEKALVYLGATGELADYDPERLFPLLADIESPNSSINEMLSELAVVGARLIKEHIGGGIDPDPTPKQPKTCPHCGGIIDE